MIQYWQEKNGDYLAIDTATNAYYLQNFNKDYFEGRATAIAGVVASVCTTSISRAFLQECKRVARKKVPIVWQLAVQGKA